MIVKGFKIFYIKEIKMKRKIEIFLCRKSIKSILKDCFKVKKQKFQAISNYILKVLIPIKCKDKDKIDNQYCLKMKKISIITSD